MLEGTQKIWSSCFKNCDPSASSLHAHTTPPTPQSPPLPPAPPPPNQALRDSGQRESLLTSNNIQRPGSMLTQVTPHPVPQALRDPGQWEELADSHKMADLSDTVHAPGPRVTATTQGNDYDKSLHDKQRVGLCPRSKGRHIKVYAFDRQMRNVENRNQPPTRCKGEPQAKFFFHFTSH